jgi:hypothetical protein
MLFQNYGLFWHADRVGWGRPGVTGELLGYRTIADGDVDFRPQRGVYALYDDKFALIYVGQAGYNDRARLYDRMNAHRVDHLAERWQRFSWFGIDPVKGRKGAKTVIETDPKTSDTATVLNHLEGILIATAEPRLNLQGGRFGDAQQFYQTDCGDYTVQQKLDELQKQVSGLEKLVGKAL